MRILVTGGAGYIGSHTIISLIEQKHEVVSVDNFCNSSPDTFDRIEEITGVRVDNYDVDLSDADDVKKLNYIQGHFDGIIHFAALKSVPDSVKYPERYHDNNIESMRAILDYMFAKSIKSIVFSSSCSVYGDSEECPVKEDSVQGEAQSPYATTKQVGESMLEYFSSKNPKLKCISLRYFNPAGAHFSGLIGDRITDNNSLVAKIVDTGVNNTQCLTVYGDDYPTRDGTCVRDYVYVCDIAEAHVKALEYEKAGYEVFNLGSGEGTTVLEMIKSFEEVSGKELNYTIGQRRPGDICSIYSDCTKARRELGWRARHTLNEIMKSALRWRLNF